MITPPVRIIILMELVVRRFYFYLFLLLHATQLLEMWKNCVEKYDNNSGHRLANNYLEITVGLLVYATTKKIMHSG